METQQMSEIMTADAWVHQDEDLLQNDTKLYCRSHLYSVHLPSSTLTVAGSINVFLSFPCNTMSPCTTQASWMVSYYFGFG